MEDLRDYTCIRFLSHPDVPPLLRGHYGWETPETEPEMPRLIRLLTWSRIQSITASPAWYETVPPHVAASLEYLAHQPGKASTRLQDAVTTLFDTLHALRKAVQHFYGPLGSLTSGLWLCNDVTDFVGLYERSKWDLPKDQLDRVSKAWDDFTAATQQFGRAEAEEIGECS